MRGRAVAQLIDGKSASDPICLLRCRDHSPVCALVNHVQVELQRFGRDDGGARRGGFAHHTSCAGLFATRPSSRTAGVGSRDPSSCSWRVDRLTSQSRVTGTIFTGVVDKHGRTVDFLLRPGRGIAAAQAFFRKALASHTDHPPLKTTLDGHWHSHRALRLLRREHAARCRVRVHSSKYLNNIVEQDHRAIKQRCGPMRGFKSFANAAVTIAGMELAHRIHKRQFSFGRGRPRVGASLRTIWDQALTP